MSGRVELYRESHTVYEGSDWLGESFVIDAPGKWRWRFVKNGRIMADSGQGYVRRIDALNGCATVLCGDTWRATAAHELAPRGFTEIGRDYITRTTDGLEWFDIPVHDLTREAQP